MDTSYFSYNWSVIASGRDALTMRPSDDDKKPYIILNLNKNGERFLPDIAKDIQPYINKGYTIYFVPVAKGHNTYYNDLQYLPSLSTSLTTENILLLDRENNFSHFIQILKNAELVISTRLHLFLIASFLGVPTKVYPYQRKILKMQEVMKKFAKKE
jgi:polysaccharide pyruvyl transferase WcaK-like protein